MTKLQIIGDKVYYQSIHVATIHENNAPATVMDNFLRDFQNGNVYDPDFESVDAYNRGVMQGRNEVYIEAQAHLSEQG